MKRDAKGRFVSNRVIGYKAFKSINGKLMCRGMVYEVGKTYTYEGEIKLCKLGFHFCKALSDVYKFYSFGDVVCKVEALGSIKEDDYKSVTDKIKIVCQISAEDAKANTGSNSTGFCNSGDRNSGNWNSGNWNSGNWNSGYSNSGDKNSGDKNSGDRNSGNWNSGNWNSGYSNSGYSNSGDRNSGSCNSGSWNSGNWNSGSWNSGFFNSEQSDAIRVFNKPCKRTVWESAKKPSFIYFNNTEWVISSQMTEKEKEQHPQHETVGGYLKTLDYKEAWQKAYHAASTEDIQLLLALPNFDAEVFEEITGIDVTDKM